MSEEYWLRFQQIRAKDLTTSDGQLSVFVPIQPHHYQKLGKKAQSELQGNGTLDSLLEIPDPDDSRWNFAQAVAHCETELANFKNSGGENPTDAISDLFVRQIEHLEGAKLGRSVVSPNGLISQEVLIPQKTYSRLIYGSQKKVDDYVFLREIGIHCLATGNIDAQPNAFGIWFSAYVSGKHSPPQRRPKYWAIWGRDRLICALVNNLTKHGISPTRNDASLSISGCDAVAEAAVKANIKAPRSFATVKKIYQKVSKQMRG